MRVPQKTIMRLKRGMTEEVHRDFGLSDAEPNPKKSNIQKYWGQRP
jgi:hypothetical protein